MLHKRLTEPVSERPSYVAMHALSFVAEGQQVVYDASGARIRVRAGQVGVMRRGLYTLSDLLASESGAFETTVVFVSDAVLREALADFAQAPRGSASTNGLSVLLGGRAGQRVRVWRNEGNTPLTNETTARAALRDLLQALVAEGGEQSLARLRGLGETPRRPLREFMQAHFDKPLTLADYAQLSGRSQRSFRRDFKARFGESPKRWLVAQRLERARQLAQTGQRSVSDIAASVGYTSTSHFIELYKGRFGVTPGAERTLTV